MYMGWVKPYLRNIRRLQSRQEYMESADIVSGFESAMMEIEVLQKKRVEGCSNVWGVVIQSFIYIATPSMAYQTEGYQRGPLHGGEVKIYMRSYAWTDEEIQAYKEMRAEEDLKMIGVIDKSLKAAMEALGDDLDTYLKAAEETVPGEEPEKPKAPEKPKERGETVLEPFVGVFKGFGELFGYRPQPKAKKKEGKDERSLAERIAAKNRNPTIIAEKKKTQGNLTFTMYTVYKNFKKTHGMAAWR
jgi:hypothetical protein